MARAISLVFTKDYIYWGSDSTYTSNWILRGSRSTGTVERMVEIDGPAYFSARTGNGDILISTCVEGSAPEKDRFARIWISSDGSRWNELARFEKDAYPFVFGYARLPFSQGSSADGNVYVYGEAVKGPSGTRVYEVKSSNPVPSGSSRREVPHCVK